VKNRREEIDYVLHIAREADVKFIRLWFTDILGHLKGFATTIEELEDAMVRGVGFDGSSIQGFARVDESDMVALPDPATFRILPWRPKQNAVARMFCDILTPKGEPFEGDPRYVLKRNMEKASKMGFVFYVGPELEYFYFRDSKSTEFLDEGNYFDQTPSNLGTELRRDTVLTLGEMGIPVKYSHHEAAPSQHEIDLQYTDALTMADSVMTARLVVKEIALERGAYATFMPKPLADVNGSGMHTNLSLFQGDRNAFYDSSDPLRLSSLARSFISGLLRHGPELTLVTNQWVNSYKRLVAGYEAPVYVSWASINRSDLVRIPAYKEGRDDSVRVEYRAPDPACNPYLAFSVLLAAGLAGIEHEYPVPAPVEENLFEISEIERRSRNIEMLPGSLLEAIKLSESSSLVEQALGQHLYHTLLTNKRIEWERYRTQITDYELRTYLPTL
jgi:glutamine synthetase